MCKVTYSKQSLIHTEATVDGKHYAWAVKTPYGYDVKIKAQSIGQHDISYPAGSMKEAKAFIQTCANIDSE